MSQAETLLNSLGDDISTFTAEPETEGHIVVGKDRHITVPEELKRIAVQYDHDIETVTFDCPRYWDDHDMSTMRVFVNYLRSDGVPGSYLCEPVTIDESDSGIMHFDWTISKNATMVQGTLSFLVCIKEVDEEGNELHHWNSELCNDMTISTGLEVDETILTNYPDIITQLLTRMDAVENIQSVITGADLVRIQAQLTNLNNSFTVYQTSNDKKIKALEAEDVRLDIRIDDLEKEITGAETAIAHSLTVKGVDVPEDMSITDVAGLIDTIEMDIPTSLRNVIITTPPNQTEYYQGEAFNRAGMVVSADFGDGVIIPVENYVVTPAIMTEGMTEVVISLTINGVTQTTTCPVSVTSVVASTMPAGALISIAESDTENAQYRVVDTDYCGNVLLVREECLDEKVKYLLSAAKYASSTKYEDSNLDSYLNTTFYSGLPSSTAEIIQPVDIPVRASAHQDAEQTYLNRHVFALSATEWGKSSAILDGESVEYTDCMAASVVYWTRQPSIGMTNMAYIIETDGDCTSGYCTTGHHVRPAFCISKNQPVKETNDGWVIASSTSSAAYMSVDDEGNATIHGVTAFAVDAYGNATITV